MIDALMYGITPSAKIVMFDRFLPENMSYRPNMVPRRLLRQHRQRFLIDAGRRDVAADAIHAQQPEREQHAVAQVGDGKQVFDRVIHRPSSGPQ